MIGINEDVGLKKKFIGLALVVGVTSTLFGAVVWQGVGAARVSTEDSTYIRKGEVVDESAFIVGSNVEVEGTIKGDLYCVGETVTISGEVEGDIICAGSKINITGTSGGGMRLAGDSVVLRGVSGGSVSVMANTFETEETTRIGRDLNGGVNSARLAGTVGRDVLLGGSSLTVVGTVGGDVEGQYQSLRIAEGAKVGGNLSYIGTRDAEVAGTVQGETNRISPESQGSSTSFAEVLILAIFLISSLLLVPLLAALAIPRQLKLMAETLDSRGLQVFTAGMLTLLVAPMALLALALTLVGIPLAATLFVVWLFILSLGSAVVSYYVGSKLFGKTVSSVIGRSLAGGLMIVALYLIPFVNVLAMLGVGIVGSGMVLIHLYKSKVFAREKK